MDLEAGEVGDGTAVKAWQWGSLKGQCGHGQEFALFKADIFNIELELACVRNDGSMFLSIVDL